MFKNLIGSYFIRKKFNKNEVGCRLIYLNVFPGFKLIVGFSAFAGYKIFSFFDKFLVAEYKLSCVACQYVYRPGVLIFSKKLMELFA